MFDVKNETVEITNGDKKDVYKINPLTGEYLEDLYFIMDAFKGEELPEGMLPEAKKKKEKEESDRILKVLSTSASKKLHRLVCASLVQSYPNQDKLTLDRFAAQHLMSFIGAVIKVNMPSSE